MQFAYIIAAALEVYVVGSNFLGKLGLGTNGGCESTPVWSSFYSGLGIVECALGASFAWVLSKGGTVYSVGGNLRGELGLNQEGGSDNPVRHDFFQNKDVINVVAGMECVWAVTKDNKVYACGRNDEGQLGIGKTEGVFRDRKDRRFPELAKLLSIRGWKMALCKGCYRSDNVFMFQGQMTDEDIQELALEAEEAKKYEGLLVEEKKR